MRDITVGIIFFKFRKLKNYNFKSTFEHPTLITECTTGLWAEFFS